VQRPTIRLPRGPLAGNGRQYFCVIPLKPSCRKIATLQLQETARARRADCTWMRLCTAWTTPLQADRPTTADSGSQSPSTGDYLTIQDSCQRCQRPPFSSLGIVVRNGLQATPQGVSPGAALPRVLVLSGAPCGPGPGRGGVGFAGQSPPGDNLPAGLLSVLSAFSVYPASVTSVRRSGAPCRYGTVSKTGHGAIKSTTESTRSTGSLLPRRRRDLLCGGNTAGWGCQACRPLSLAGKSALALAEPTMTFPARRTWPGMVIAGSLPALKAADSTVPPANAKQMRSKASRKPPRGRRQGKSRRPWQAQRKKQLYIFGAQRPPFQHPGLVGPDCYPPPSAIP